MQTQKLMPQHRQREYNNVDVYIRMQNTINNNLRKGDIRKRRIRTHLCLQPPSIHSKYTLEEAATALHCCLGRDGATHALKNNLLGVIIEFFISSKEKEETAPSLSQQQQPSTVVLEKGYLVGGLSPISTGYT